MAYLRPTQKMLPSVFWLWLTEATDVSRRAVYSHRGERDPTELAGEDLAQSGAVGFAGAGQSSTRLGPNGAEDMAEAAKARAYSRKSMVGGCSSAGCTGWTSRYWNGWCIRSGPSRASGPAALRAFGWAGLRPAPT